MLAPGAISKVTLASFSLKMMRLEAISLPSRRAVISTRTLIVAWALPEQTPPSLSQVSTSESAPALRLTDRLLAMPASVGAATRPAGRDAGAGGALASACAHPFTQVEIASTRANTDGRV